MDAINDKNVLPFRVDYIKTMDVEEEITDEMVWDINREKVMMAPYVALIAANHNVSRTDVPMNQQGAYEKQITIEDDVWIGYGAKILAGVTVGKGAVIGAGAVVTKNVAPYAVVGGIPAKEIKMRN